MKKIVNGKLADIGDIKLFELAFEGIAINKLAISSINTTIDGDMNNNIIKECIEAYNEVYRSLPFPLYSIETNVKYAAIVKYIKEKMSTEIVETEEISKEKLVEDIEKSNITILKDLNFWIKDGLYIMLDSERALKIVGNTWGIEPVKELMSDNTDLELYKNDTGYKEFKWAIDKLIKNESIAGLYEEFMPEFLLACKNEPMIIKWELNKILDFGYVPEEVETEKNKIIDIDNGTIYIIDLYSKGKVKTKDKIQCIDCTQKDLSRAVGIKDKYINVYEYDLYKKEFDDSNEAYEKLTITKNNAFDSIFKDILKIGMSNGNVDDIVISGILKGGYIIYSIDGRIICYNFNKPDKKYEVANNMKIYSIFKNKLYLKKTIRISKGINKEIIYAMDLETKNLKLCKISYKNT